MVNKSIKTGMIVICTNFRKLLGIKAGNRDREGLRWTVIFKCYVKKEIYLKQSVKYDHLLNTAFEYMGIIIIYERFCDRSI